MLTLGGERKIAISMTCLGVYDRAYHIFDLAWNNGRKTIRMLT